MDKIDCSGCTAHDGLFGLSLGDCSFYLTDEGDAPRCVKDTPESDERTRLFFLLPSDPEFYQRGDRLAG